MQCKDCHSTNLIETSMDLTCRECGLEQGFGNIVADYNYMQEFCCPWQSQGQDSLHNMLCMHSMPGLHNNQKLSSFIPSVQDALHLPDDVIDTAIKMYYALQKLQKIKGLSRRTEMFVACCYFALRQTHGGAGSNRSFDNIILETTHLGVMYIAWACSLLQKHLSEMPEFKELFMHSMPSMQSIATQTYTQILQQTNLNKYIACIGQAYAIKAEQIKSIRKALFKIIDRIEKKNVHVRIKPDKFIAGIIFMSISYCKIPVKMGVIAKCCGTTETTILRSVEWIKENVFNGN